MLLPDRFMRHLPRWDPETRPGFLPHQVAPRRPPPQGSHHPSPQHRLTETSPLPTKPQQLPPRFMGASHLIQARARGDHGLGSHQ